MSNINIYLNNNEVINIKNINVGDVLYMYKALGYIELAQPLLFIPKESIRYIAEVEETCTVETNN